ncbi:LysR family transcriptional regulator [Polymorphobacter sp.]|uniref:LysR family transcriptional regulator n=1 Tax=Polymorphobacter sp. TaxID=1909290 RepID=UPI003F7100D1
MELRHLRHFVAVVDAGNLSRAADKVCITQPALTRSIKNLEEILGAVLLERRPRGIVPTPAGNALYHYAQLMLNEAHRARDEVRAVQKGTKGELAIGIAAMFADHIIDRAVAAVCGSGRDVAMTVTQGFLEELVEALRDGRLDVIFSNLSNMKIPDDVTVEPILDIHAYVFASAGHRLAAHSGLDKQALLGERWAVVDQPHMKDFLDHYFSADGLRVPDYVVRTNSLNLISSLIANSGFIGILPEHVVQRRSLRGTICRLDAPGCPVVRKVGLMTRKSMPLRPVVEDFMAEVREACTVDAFGAWEHAPD